MRNISDMIEYLKYRRIALKAQLFEIDRLEAELNKSEKCATKAVAVPKVQYEILEIIMSKHSRLVPATTRSISNALSTRDEYGKRTKGGLRKYVTKNLKEMRENKSAFRELQWTQRRVAEHRGHEYLYFTQIIVNK